MEKYQFEMTGANGTLYVTEHSVIIKREGANAFMAFGLSGEKEIPFSSITAIQFKEAGVLVKGYIQFSTLGGVEARGGVNQAWYDENTVMLKSANNSMARQIKDYIKERMGKQQTTVVAQTSNADELLKYKQLLDMGAISQEEFDLKKKELLS